jgi:hypothetical protein
MLKITDNKVILNSIGDFVEKTYYTGEYSCDECYSIVMLEVEKILIINPAILN